MPIDTLSAVKDTIEPGLFQDYFVPVITIIIALLAIVISWRVFQVTRKHNELSLKPYLIFRVNTSHSSGKVKLYIANKGTGPCIFDQFDIVYDNNSYKKMYDPFKAISAKFNYSDDDFDSSHQSFVYPLKTNNTKYGLLPNEEKTLLKYQLKNKARGEAIKFYEEVKKLEFVYSYHDFYENKSSVETFTYKDFHAEDEGEIE